ncbi:MAG: dihydroorotate dehydrogenase [Phycisphaerales bacterium]|jgi:dihydroorotate dehydrogenase (NAD+) catalytic subunit|nr:dihydroorotate dehydrogenase [Phycisphaerales bacterium]
MPDLSQDLAGIHLCSPLIAAAGTAGYGPELASVDGLRGLGAVVTKSITLESRTGNPPMRVTDLQCGMMNAVGLANVGLDRFIAETALTIRDLPIPAIPSIAGGSIDDYEQVAAAMQAMAFVKAVEVNVSCPNTDDGRAFAESPESLQSLLVDIRSVLKRTAMIVKLPLDFGKPSAAAEVAVEAGADALTIMNTVPAMAIDVRTRRSRLGRMAGGASGPGIHPLAVRMVADVHRDVAGPAGVPIIGLGGVMRWQDAAEFILAGASMVGIGTALFVDPRRPRKILKGLTRWVRSQGCQRLDELVGAMER